MHEGTCKLLTSQIRETAISSVNRTITPILSCSQVSATSTSNTQSKFQAALRHALPGRSPPRENLSRNRIVRHLRKRRRSPKVKAQYPCCCVSRTMQDLRPPFFASIFKPSPSPRNLTRRPIAVLVSYFEHAVSPLPRGPWQTALSSGGKSYPDSNLIPAAVHRRQDYESLPILSFL